MYEPSKLEKAILKLWEDEHIYSRAKEKSAKGKKFYFCDGPPYATGQIHPGTAWNKVIKDAVCRQRRQKGFNVRAQPGFDTHGLPIEVKVEQELKLKSKKGIEEIGVPKFIEKCKAFATQYIEIMSKQFKLCGVWMDFDHPYITYKPEYIEASWQTIKVAHEKNLLSRGVYVLPYCNRCETTLANYELEYGDQEDPSIYVKFKVKGTPNEYLVIWTTTPWTLVSNMAVMVHPTYTYVKVKVGTDIYIVAKDRLDALSALGVIETPIIIGEISGKKLEGLEYEHPLQHKIGKKCVRKVVLSDEFVTLEDGSGLVHCAPGHGPQDFIIGKRFGIEIFCPVDVTGAFTDMAGAYAGIKVREANKQIIDDLDKEAGALLRAGKISHRYPHCWRCKTPLIFVSTDQWFITVSKTKARMHDQINSIRWVPEFARTRFSEFVKEAPDWCISRQRYWGIPLPIWICEKEGCKKMKVIGSASELPHPIKDLHKPYIDEVHYTCECGGQMNRVNDILDVWFDSGNAIWACLDKDEQDFYPADFIVEGKDQTRGWFYSLLGSGVVKNDEIPYRNVMMHGFFVDEKGEKMSKSVGNFVPLEEIVEKYGADTFRLWCLNSVIWDDLRFNWDEIKEANRSLAILHNLGVFLERFSTWKGKPPAIPEKLSLEDMWILSRLHTLIKTCDESFECFEVHKAARAIRFFIVEDLSRFYMKLAKRRLSAAATGNPDDVADANAVLAILYHTIYATLRVATPVIPFICEDIYLNFFKKYEHLESVSFAPLPELEARAMNPLLERQVAIAQEVAAAITSARQTSNLKLRWPLEEASIICSSTEVSNAVEHLANMIEGMANVRKIKLVNSFPSIYELKPRHAKIGAAFKQESAKVLALLPKADAVEVSTALSKDGKFMLDGKYPITRDLVEITEHAPGHAVAQFSEGKIYLKTAMNPDLYADAMAREVSRRVQIMRKELGLVESDKISVNISSDDELIKLLEKKSEQIANSTNATEVSFGKEKLRGGLMKEWEIEDFTAEITVKKQG